MQPSSLYMFGLNIAIRFRNGLDVGSNFMLISAGSANVLDILMPK